MLDRPLFIGSDIYRLSSYGERHPLAIPRVSTVIDLCRALGWLQDEAYRDSPAASSEQLTRFHDPDYVAAVAAAEASQAVSETDRRRFNLGTIDAPVFAEMFRRPATAAGGAILAAKLVAAGGTVFHPAGGTHHGRRDRASGFCFFNDPVLGILALRDGGVERVAYVDIDAHHGDGVEAAFADDPRVLTISLHEAGRWPFTGDTARAGEAAVNFPVPQALNDSEFGFVLEQGILPLVERHRPEAVMLQAGADSLADDPLAKLGLSNGAHRDTANALRPLAPRLIVTGGGGYNPWSVARCWSGIWATLAGHDIPERLPHRGEAVLRALRWRRAAGRNPPEHWFTTVADLPRPGPIRPEIRAMVAGAPAAG